MAWADLHIHILQQGLNVTFRPQGNSMTGLIESGQKVTVAPVLPEDLKVSDIVLCKVGRKQYLHLIKHISGFPTKYTIGNNKGKINGGRSIKEVKSKGRSSKE